MLSYQVNIRKSIALACTEKFKIFRKFKSRDLWYGYGLKEQFENTHINWIKASPISPHILAQLLHTWWLARIAYSVFAIR